MLFYHLILCTYLHLFYVNFDSDGNFPCFYCVFLSFLQIIVATPGRLLDHIENRSGISVRLMGLKMLVLDEADLLLKLGFRKDIEKIVDCVPRHRQSMLFSATIPKEVGLLPTIAFGYSKILLFQFLLVLISYVTICVHMYFFYEGTQDFSTGFEEGSCLYRYCRVGKARDTCKGLNNFFLFPRFPNSLTLSILQCYLIFWICFWWQYQMVFSCSYKIFRFLMFQCFFIQILF